jgi:hypothetical protein
MNDLPDIDPALLTAVNIDRPTFGWGTPSAPRKGIMSLQECADAEAPRRIGTHPALGAGYGPPARAHSHYFKDVSRLDSIDIYRVVALFAVTDPCLQHAVKKLLVAGGRGGGKDISRDVREAIDTLKRWEEMRAEEANS